MKKFTIGIALLAVIVVSLGAVGYAFAQNQTSPMGDFPFSLMHGYQGWFGHEMMGDYDDYGHGPEMMGYHDDYDHGFGMMDWDEEHGPMHDSMVAAFSDALGLSIDEIEARIKAGETMWDIAESEGLSSEDVRALMESYHDGHYAEAVENGWMTPEQAELMEDHMAQMWDGTGYGSFGGHCGGFER